MRRLLKRLGIPASSRMGTEPEQANRRAIGAERVWYIALCVMAVAVTLSALVSAASVNPAFCAVCHSLEYASLQDSAHSGTHCDSCHVASGPLGLVEQRLSVVSMLPAMPLTMVEARRAGSTPIDRRRCLDCHEAMIPKTIEVGGIRMNHRAPNKEGWSCDRCHDGAGHGRERVAASYSMDTCLECHSAGPKNIATCGTCHVEGSEKRARSGTTPWKVTHGGNWKSTHGMGNLKTCKACHAAEYCVSCHGVAIPHPPNYMGSHGKEVLRLENGDQECRTCHKTEACESCHGVDMPHPDRFVKEHPETARDKGATCERCHERSQCEECHTRHTHPGLSPDRIDALRARPVNVQ